MTKTFHAPQHPTLTVHTRARQGRRPVRRMRRESLTPAVVYGKHMEPLSVAVNQRALIKLLQTTVGEHPLVTLRLEDLPAAKGAAPAGNKPWEKPALIQAIQHDPVDGHILHVDFHTIVLTERLKLRVPLVLKGEPVGVKQEGGILEHFLREIEVECLPADIPASVELDVTALTIGRTVHVSDLTPPANTKITTPPESAVVSVLQPKVEKPEEEAAAVTEPEVLREKKETAEGEGEGKAAEPPSAKPEKAEKKDAKP